MKLLTKSTLFSAGFLIFLGATIFFYTENIIAGAFRKQTTDHFHIIAEQTKNAFLAYVDGTKTQTLDWVSGVTLQQKAKAVLDSPANSPARARHANEFVDYVKKYRMPFDPSILTVDVLDKNGIVAASTMPERIGLNEGAKPHYGFDEMIVSNVGDIYTKGITYEEDEHAEPMIHTAARLFTTNEKGEFEPLDGVLLIHFSSIDKISKILKGEPAAPNGAPTHETFLTSYQTSDIYLVNKDKLLVTRARNGVTKHARQTVDTAPVRECLETGQILSGEYDNYEGVRVFGTSECLAEDGLVLILEAHRDEVFAPLTTLTRYTLFGGIIILIFGTLVSFFFTRRPLENVDEIVRAARNVSGGDLTAKAAVHTRDELGYLAATFNNMVASVRDVEKTLRASKEETERSKNVLETIFSHAHLMVAYLDRDFNFIKVNRAYATADNKEPEFFPGKNHFDLFPNTENEALFKSVITTGEPYHAHAKAFTYAGHPERGTTYWDWTLAPVKDTVGNVTGIILTLLDVTKEARAHEETESALKRLEQSEENLKKAQEVAHLGSWILDLQKNQLVWSEEAYRIFGVPLGTPLTYETFLECVHPDDRTYVDQEWNAALKGKPYDIEHRILINNVVRWVRERAELEVDEHGTILRGSGTTQDITDHKEIENELRASRERYLSALDSMLEGCTILSQDWKFLYLNDEALKHVRRTREEVTGKTLFDTYPGIEHTDMYEAFKRGMMERTPQRLETSFTFPDGYTGWYDLSIIPVLEGIFILSIDITERKKAGEMLLRLNTAVQSSGEAVFMTDAKGVITFINPEFSKLYGYTADEIVNKNTPRILKSGRQPVGYYEKFWGAIGKGQTVTNEVVNKTKDGRLIDIEESVNPVVEESGLMVGYLAVHRDITERKKTLEAIRENEEKFRSVYEGSNDAIILLDDKGFIDCNKRALEMFGVPDKEAFLKLQPADISPFLQPDGRTSASLSAEKINEAFEKGLSRFDWLYAHTSGMEIPAEVLLVAFTYQNKRILQATVRDITDRKRTEHAIQERDRALEHANRELSVEKEAIQKEKVKDEALLVSIGEGMVATDDTGHLITINPAAEKLFGWSAQEILGKILTDMVPAFDEQGVEISEKERPVAQVIATQQPVSRDTIYFSKKGGARVPVAMTVSPVILGDKLIGTIAIFRDITKEKELEETRRDLLSLASHQLRTPLSGTKWLIETLRRGLHGPLTDAQRDYLDEIYKINERMTTLVFDMLNVLRMESGIVPAKKERVSVDSIIATMLGTLKPAAKNRQVTIAVVPHEDIFIKTDPTLLRNILENFVSNAINYSPTGQEVQVQIKRVNNELVFAIRDFGIGIPKDEQAQIFKRFYRASNAKTYNTRGTGLGLYIASILSKKIGALLTFDSEEGKGSTFYVYVPVGDNGSLPENTTHV